MKFAEITPGNRIDICRFSVELRFIISSIVVVSFRKEGFIDGLRSAVP